jgi:hypothetical protein
MSVRKLFRKRTVVPVLLVAGVGAGGLAMRELTASDHQQTALTELSPRLDINDVWAFPGSSDDRIVLAMTVGSPIAGARFFGTGGAQTANFDPNALYQFKIDNNADGMEDVVLQFSFDQMANGSQTVDVMGPVSPRDIGALGATQRDAFSTSTPSIRRGAVDSNLTANLTASGAAAAGQMQVYAGLRDDPFYVDLEQFFRIIPDRRPTQGPLSTIGGVIPMPVASAFRVRCDGSPQGAFTATFGCATDFLAGLNALAIVVELPESQLTRGQGNGSIGIWATVSK